MLNRGMNRNKWTTIAIIEKLERDEYIQNKIELDHVYHVWHV